jgi:hypothetical protein
MVPPSENQAQFVIGGECFPTKKAVEERARGILAGTPLYCEVSGQDLRFLRAFFCLHPNADRKRARELDSITVVPGLHGCQRRFEVTRTDGTSTDISYRKPLRALTGLDSHRTDVVMAMRRAVDDQAWEFRKSQGEAAYDEDLYVDHQWPWTFDRLVKDFLAGENAAFEDVKLLSEDGKFGSELAEEWLRKWTEYHRAHARLRLLPRALNSRLGARNPAEVLEDDDVVA